MSENTIPEKIQEVISDVAETMTEEVNYVEDLGDKTLAELSEMFVNLKNAEDSMLRSKEAEAIKTAFHRLLSKSKSEIQETLVNPFEVVEQNFKSLYSEYKKERADFNKLQDEQREENLKTKEALIEELKTLVESGEDMSSQFPVFRQIQNKWKEAGPVPAKSFRDLNEKYQHNVEKFYDMVKISRDLRDLDFKKNYEAKIAFCEAAEKLAENDNVVAAFNELQHLHDQWKEFGPVAKEVREDIWNRFKLATSVINKKYQAHFDTQKKAQQENLIKKTALCEQIEELVSKEIKSTSEWSQISRQIEELQEQWRKIGFATKKDNQKIYDRFRASCDSFYAAKREHYNDIKGSMSENLEKKLALIAQAEALKDSTEWKKTTDLFISLQKQWKEIGAVPRKKSEALWKRFRAACDEFFANRDANAGGENDFYGNLKAKKKLIKDIQAFEPGDDESANTEAMREFNDRWNSIGHIPFKEKDNIIAEYRQAMTEKFPLFSQLRKESSRSGRNSAPRSPKDILIQKYRDLQQDITTYENNIGFFSASKGSEALLKQMQAKIDEAKAELKTLEDKIRKAEEEQD